MTTATSAIRRSVRLKNYVVPSAFDLEIQRENGTPNLLLGFEVREGVPQCRRAELRSTEDGREVLASDLRGVRLEDLLEFAVKNVAMTETITQQEGGTVTAIEPVEDDAELSQTLKELRAVRQEARRHVTDDVLREVARIYRENIGANPTTAVAQHTGRSHRTAALYVQRAREKGFLGASVGRRAGER